MHIVFVYGAYENLGIEYLSAVLKQEGHQVSLVYDPLIFRDALLDINMLGKVFSRKYFLMQKLENLKPDLIAFSCVTDWFQWMYEWACECKKIMPDVPIVFGGIHATGAAQYLVSLPEIDFACVGEGEEALLDLANALEKGDDPSKIPNIWGKGFSNPPRPLIQHLDLLPFPDHDLFYDQVPYFRKAYTIMGSRGCPFSCTYCCNNCLRKLYADEKQFFRRRSVDNIISELKFGLEKWNFKEVLIEDDIFTGDSERIRYFCDQYSKYIAKPFVCVTHPLAVNKEEVELLRDAGCIQMEIGIQTLNEQVRKKYLNRNETNAEIVKALKILHETGIPFNIDHIVGLPEDTFDWQLFSLRLYNEVRPNRLLFFYITWYPSTGIADIEKERGNLTPELEQKIVQGKSESDEGHGSIEDLETREKLDKLRFLFGWLPLLPKRIVRFMLKPERISRLPGNRIFCKIIPDIIAVLKGREPRGKMILKKYLYHILRLGF